MYVMRGYSYYNNVCVCGVLPPAEKEEARGPLSSDKFCGVIVNDVFDGMAEL